VIPAKGKRQNFDSPQAERGSAAIINGNVSADAPTLPSMAADLLYLTDFSASSARVTETVFVIVGRDSGSAAAYRISVWRIVVQQPVGNPNPSTIPHKET
jgi:hypothetical protein